MITARAWSGKKYAVLGLGRSGRATVDALLASGAEVVAWDENEAAREAFSANGVSFADPLTLDLTGFEAIVVTPGLPLNRHPIKDHAALSGVSIIGDIELFAQARAELPPHKVVGITGTNGKSTTTALVHHILETAGVPSLMGGNIGLPILGQEPLPEGGVYVLELSSYQIDLTQSLDCDVAVLLNVTPDHLDRYESFEAYAASKARLFEMQKTGISVFPTRDRPTSAIRERLIETRQPLSGPFPYPPPDAGSTEFTLKIGRSSRILDVWGGEASQPDWPNLQGPHNLQNAIAAIEICRLLWLRYDQIGEGLRSFPGLPHRMQRVRDRDGVLFVNDSKATNPDSAAPALAAHPHIHWILGGLAKTESLGPCEQHLDHVRAAYTIGSSGPMFAQLLRGRVPVTEAETLERAVTDAAAAAKAGEVVLLSPACASFDQFKDFEARGDAFRAAVEALS